MPRLTIQRLQSPLGGPFDLEVEPGACIAVSGASGSGKSLFLRMVADLDPNEGDVLLDGRSRSGMPAPDWRRQVTYVAAESGWWRDEVLDHFTAGQAQAVRELAHRLGVGAAQVAGAVARLSTGERQRLALVRALLLEAPVMLLDEPTAALDPISTAKVEALLVERMAAGAALIVVTHDEHQPARLGAQHYLMVDRRLERLS